MTEKQFTVFIVDDDPSARLVASFPLERLGVAIREFGDGPSCLEALGDAPDVVVLDIEMPGMDGIAVCRALRETAGGELQVIFVSAHDDLEIRLNAYDAGGNDFIVKPYAPEELAKKIELARRVLEDRRAMMGQAQFAQQAAFTSMASMGEMGVTQEFLRASFGCRTAEELGQALCGAASQYGLQAVVELRDEGDGRCFASGGQCSALEASILCHARGLERIFQFRDRLVVNYPHASMLVHNLPLDDADRVGRMRDHLAVLVEGADARYRAMLSEARRLAQSEAIVAAVNELTATLEEIEANQASHRHQVLEIAHEQLDAMTQAFVHLGLSEGQEESLVAMTQASVDRMAHLQDYGIAMSVRLREVIARLKQVAGDSGG